MQRITFAALTLSLTALVAWGCNSTSQSPTTVPSPSSDLTAPVNPDIAPSAGDDDDRSTNVGGEGGPGHVEESTPGPILGHDDTDPGGKGSTVQYSCDGTPVLIPDGKKTRVFEFTSPSAEATNIADPIFYYNPEKHTSGTINVRDMKWELVLDGGGATDGARVISVIGLGDWADEGDERSGKYYTSTGMASFHNKTCTSVSSLDLAHSGPRGLYNTSLTFVGGLRLTRNGYKPKVGETNSAIALVGTGGKHSWTSEVTDVYSAKDMDYIVFNLHPTEADDSGVEFNFVWNDDYGIVSWSDPFITEDGFDFTFPGNSGE